VQVPWIIGPALERLPQYSHWEQYDEWYDSVAARFISERILGY